MTQPANPKQFPNANLGAIHLGKALHKRAPHALHQATLAVRSVERMMRRLS